MAELVVLPTSSRQTSPPSQVRGPGRLLNTIIEEDREEGRQQQQQHQQHQQRQRHKPQPIFLDKGDNRMLRPPANPNIDAWLSPKSDHFPTPRGVNFLSAPILPSSPSNDSSEEAISPATSSSPWNNRSSVMTDVTEFEDIYGVSDDESGPGLTSSTRNSNRRGSKHLEVTTHGARKTLPPLAIPQFHSHTNGDRSATSAGVKGKLISPVPPTPPTRVTMSPEVFSFMQARQAQDVPATSAPPSLDGSMDGSLSSEQLAQMSAPPTPVMNNDEADKKDDWSGVRLQPGALATLQALSRDTEAVNEEDHQQPEQVLEVTAEPAREMRQQGLRIFTNVQLRAPRAAELTPGSQSSHRRSLADLTRLDIPSPGGFFSGLSPRARNTWHIPSKSPEDLAPPTSTTAEQFYRCPWNRDASVPPVPPIPNPLPSTRPVPRLDVPVRDSPLATVSAGPFPSNTIAEQFYRAIVAPSEPIERIIEANDDDGIEDDMPTARPIVPTVTSSSPIDAEPAADEVPAEPEEAATEIVTAYDPEYARKQQKVALGNLDRTEMWLLAQRAYLKPVDNAEIEDDKGLATIPEAPEEQEGPTSKESGLTSQAANTSKKKVVRFSPATAVTTTKSPRSLPSKWFKQESAYYRAFQDYFVRAGHADAFVHRLPRFQALQAQRVCMKDFHRNQLLGKYQLSVLPQSAKKRLSANVARGDDILQDDPEKLRREKEQEAIRQMAIPSWHVAATKLLNGGRLILAPVSRRLNRLSRVTPVPPKGGSGNGRERARVLDLGGHSTCDWAWHCALQHPSAKVYTVTTKAARQLSNANVRGPPNHRQVAVERLARLPFADAQFDLVSARELHTALKFVGGNGEDEWEGCLRECMRVLKPGGYLEFALLDSDIMNAGPLGLAKSVEFGFTLKTLGYDPAPTKMWLGRLARAGFDEVHRAWMYLPMGERPSWLSSSSAPPLSCVPTSSGVLVAATGPAVGGGQKPLPALPNLRPGPDGEPPRTVTLEAMVTGSSDAVASMTGLTASWSWERWLLRCEMEKVAGELRLADTVTAGVAMAEAGKCLDGVAAVVEEGRARGAGWRVLTGYARKPVDGTGCIPMKMAV